MENEVRNSVYPLKEINYADLVEVFVFTKADEEATFTNWMAEMTNGQAKIELVEKEFLEFRVN